ncbi:hypothetical protein EOD40_09480 [Flavobacterium sufflavum]|uniref:RiboL-PSP-HEPN domain-containing protein n=1 Tax=Flavobacterium sufflavum TaxID=1921138 RepID=A0A3S2V4W2_9FLAO|nr:HEPN domain-containing protein [Flavobacterium sufflavum]RVT76720.1 hypothetical protein EOD40_09480 [Flavobacterium sufflavum]
MEKQEEESNKKLAKRLGLTYDELMETDWHIETDESKEGIIYGNIIYFVEIPKRIRKKIIGLDGDNQVYLEHNYDYEDYYNDNYEDYFETIIANSHYYDSFQTEINNLIKLNKIDLDDTNLNKILKRQIYISAITCLETFLSDTFVNQTNENETYLRNFVETFPVFTNKRLNLNQIYEHFEKLNKIARKEMLDVIYHNLDKVENMYRATFKIDFPDIQELSKAVAQRHDLVHRNGKTKEGEEVNIDEESIKKLIAKIYDFVESISNLLKLKG